MAAQPALPDLSDFFAATGLMAGIDEAGRGCLAGPVAAAAVILPEFFCLPGLADSKALAPRKREKLAREIKSCACCWSLGLVWPARIDRINILNASLEAMAKAAGALRLRPARLCIDGPQIIPSQTLQKAFATGSHLPGQRAIVRGDALVPSISAASILAKTFRDKLMCALARKYPGYGFEKHKGYGTKAHYSALAKLGPSPIHRMTFRGVTGEYLQGRLL